MNHMIKAALITTTLCLLTQPAIAEIYSCGPGCYTSDPKQSKGKAQLGNKIGSYSVHQPSQNTPKQAQSQTQRNRSTRTTQTSLNTPTKQSTAQTNTRRTILEQELNNERNALAKAQQALAAGRAVNNQSDAEHQNRVRQLENAVLDRQQNIQALQRELNRM